MRKAGSLAAYVRNEYGAQTEEEHLTAANVLGTRPGRTLLGALHR